MNSIIKKFFSIFFIILLFSFVSYETTADTTTTAADDTTTKVICNIIKYVFMIGGPLMTVVFIGAALMAIFGRMPWPALFALGMFCAVFFGARTLVQFVMKGTNTGGSATICPDTDTDKDAQSKKNP